MSFTVCGVGTTLYGHAVPPEHQLLTERPKFPYIKTEWYTIFWIPIWPLRSYLVHEVIRRFSLIAILLGCIGSEYRMTRLPNLHWPQVGRGYIFTAVIFLFFLSWPYIDDPLQQHREVSPRTDSLYTLASDFFSAGDYDSAAV